MVNAEKFRKSRDEKIRELSEQLHVSVGNVADDENLSEQDVEDLEDTCKSHLSKKKQDLQELKARLMYWFPCIEKQINCHNLET